MISDIKGIQVSYFIKFLKSNEDKSLEMIFDEIKNGGDKKDTLLNILDKQKMGLDYKDLKKTLNGFTPSGSFVGQRKIVNLKHYSGIIVLDVDNLGERQLAKFKKKVNACSYTLAAFTSPSGTGLKILVRVDTSSDIHEIAYKQVKSYYEDEIGLEIDTSGKDVSRLCYISYDSKLYVNWEAVVFKIFDSFQAHYKDAIRITKLKEQYIDNNKNNFLHYLACNCNRLGIFAVVAKQFIMEDYNNEDVEGTLKTIESAYANKEEHNSTEKSKESIEPYLQNKYDFRYNVFTGEIEYKRKSDKDFQMLNDYCLNSLIRELKINKINIGREALDNRLKSDFTPIYHPLKEYLISLPKWDKKTDYISALGSKVKTDDDEFFKDAFKRWFVGLVGCGLDDNTINQMMIIFSGSQGLGKSTFIKNLLPDELKKYAYSGMIQPNSKDTLIHLSECLIIDMDELASLNRKENNDVKELITKAKIKIRRPYGRNPENLARRASFIGSINDEEFLTDLSGNRRHLCFKVDSIDYKSTVNYVGVFSQAFDLYRSGFKFYFDGNEIDMLNKRNEMFRKKSPIEEIVLGTYKPAKNKKEARFYLSATELLSKFNSDTNVQLNTTNHILLGKVLANLGFEKVKKGGLYKYAIDLAHNYDSSQEDLPLKMAS